MVERSVEILLVEDNAGDVSLLRHMLKGVHQSRFRITQVARLSEAAECLSKYRFDVALLDLSLPDSQGIETFVNLQAQMPTLPIVVLTGHDDERLALEAVRRGAQDYLVKGKVEAPLLARALQYAIERQQTQEELLKYQTQLRSLSSKLSLTEQQERRRIAGELHDFIGQNLAFARIKLSELQDVAPEGSLKESLAEVGTLIRQAIGYTRSLTSDLSSPVLYELGFAFAVEALVEQFRDRHGLRVEFSGQCDTSCLPEETRGVLYQAVRELLINVVKHAHATRVSVSVCRTDGALQIRVADDGIGFDPAGLSGPAGKHGGFGLFNIRERLDLLGGVCTIESDLSRGTQVEMCVPVPAAGDEKQVKKGRRK